MDCAMIIGWLCLAKAASADVSTPNMLGQSANMRIGDASVTVYLGADNLNAIDTSIASRACAGGNCLEYIKFCQEQPGEIACSYSTGNSYIGGWLRVKAPDRNAFKAVENELGITVTRGNGDTAIPLSQFSIVWAPPRRN